MAVNFPVSLDSFSNPSPTDYQDIVPHSTQHANLNDAVELLQAKVGINGSADTNSLDYKVTQVNPLTTKGDIFVRSATGNTRLPVGTDGYMLVADSSETLWVKYISPSSGGTVTTASVASANGFTGSVATATTTPAITIGTSITGIVKGNGTSISAATAWTDYYAPGSTDVAVADGWTGVSSLTAYAPIFWGTTSTNPVQSGTVGSAWEVLTSNWPSALPTFQSNTVYQSTTQYQKGSTGTVTAYSFTLNGGTLSTANCIEGEILFSNLQYSSTSLNIVINIWSDLSTTTVIVPNDATIYSGVFRFRIYGNWSTSSQKITSTFQVGRGWSVYSDFQAQSVTSTFDSTSNQTVNIKYTSNNSGASAMTSEVIKVIKL